MDAEPDYYEILEVHPKASPEVIARAYRTLVSRHHPDLQPPEKKAEAEERMKLLNEAYRVLSDPARRAEYDRRYRQRFVWMGGEPGERSATAGSTAASPETTPPRHAPAATMQAEYCAYHPGVPRAASCHECGRPICEACVRFSSGHPVCPRCLPSPLWNQFATGLRRATVPLSGLSWPLNGAAVAIMAAAIVVAGPLFFPALLALCPASPWTAYLLSCFLGLAVAVGPVMWLVFALERARRTWIGTCALFALALGGWAFGLHWLRADHASFGRRAVSEGRYLEAFQELSAAELRGAVTADPQLRHCYGVAVLRLADEWWERRSWHQLTLSRVAVRFADDIVRGTMQSQPSERAGTSAKQEGRAAPSAGQLDAETKILLVEALSRALFRSDTITRKQEWERAMTVFGVPQAPAGVPSREEPARPASSRMTHQQTSQTPSGAELVEQLRGKLMSLPAEAQAAQWYVAAVCWCEMAEVLRRPEVELASWADNVNNKLQGVSSTIPPVLEPARRFVAMIAGPSPKIYDYAARAAIEEVLNSKMLDRWQRCSPNVQRMVEEVRNEWAARR